MNSAMRFILLLLLLDLSAMSQTDSYRADILKACRSFLGCKSYSITLHYKLFLDNKKVTPFQERQVKMLRVGENF